MAKTIFKWIALFFGAFIVQSTLVKSVAIFGIKPDLLIVVLFVFATKTGVLPAVYAGFFLGLAQDLYSPAILGQNALAKTVVGVFSGMFNEKMMRLDPIFQAILLLVVFMLNDMVVSSVYMVKVGGGIGTLLAQLFMATLPRALYSLLFAALPYLWELFAHPVSRR